MTQQHDDDLDGELPPHLRQLLHDGSEGPPMSAATSERLLGRVLVSVGAAAAATATVAAVTNVGGTGAATTAVATTATTTTTAATAATTGLGVAMKAAIVAAVVGVAGVVGVVALRQPASPISAFEVPVASPVLLPPSVPVVPAVPVEVAPVEVVPVETAPVEVAPVAPVEVAGPKPKPAPSSSMQPSPSVWELPMLEQARAALSSGRPEEALALVEDHQRRAPASPLLEESAAVRVMALSRAGRADEATAAAAAFLRRWPESLFGERVRRVLR